MAGITRDWELVLKSLVSSSWETVRREQGSRMQLCGFLCMEDACLDGSPRQGISSGRDIYLSLGLVHQSFWT